MHHLVFVIVVLAAAATVKAGALSPPDLVGAGPLPPTNGAQYAGYVTVNVTSSSDMYYWFFEANDPSESTPVVVWLEGGPGIGALFQVFYGMGPYRLDPDDPTDISTNPHSWLSDAHLLFLDNPCGVGFSRVALGGEVRDQEQVAEQLYNAIDSFFALHPSYRSAPLYLFGESYGGKYVPSLAYYIHERKGGTLNLQGIGIGDGLTDTPTQVQSFADFLESSSLYTPFEAQEIRKQQELFEYYYEQKDYEQASNTFWDIVYNAQFTKNFNMYDTSCTIQCSGDLYDWSGYTVLLGMSEVQTQIHADHIPYASPSSRIAASMNADVCKSVASVMPTLLSSYRVLLYQGSYDFIVNQIGAERWLSKISWHGLDQWQRSPRASWWSKDNDVAPGSLDLLGYVQQSSNLTYVLLPHAGHFAAADQPATAHAMALTFLANASWSLQRPHTQ